MWTFVVSVTLLACAGAVAGVELYPYGDGSDQLIPFGSETSPPPNITLNVPIVFYGEIYKSIYLNKYGVLSFKAGIPTFLNMELPLPYPSIAPFYVNADNSAVFFRETDDPFFLGRAKVLIKENFHEYSDFSPTSAFIATWYGSSYIGRPDLKNTFQVALISNGNETFVEFIYAETGIQWTQKEPAPANILEAKAQAGFSSEDNRSFILRGSGSDQIRNIQSWSNTRIPGWYLFRVGNIPPNGNIAGPDEYERRQVDEEEEDRMCARSGSSACHIQASCINHPFGACCQCNEGFYGNGKSCVKEAVPLRVRGKVAGLINDVPLMDLDIQTYVVVADGRIYTSLSPLPSRLGESFQLLNILGGAIGWLFAKPSAIAKNGYQFTGGYFNHTADVLFPATGDRITINQTFSGHDVFDQLSVNIDIRGTIPVVVPGTKYEISDYEEEYTLMEPGVISSKSTRTFVNKNTGGDFEQKIKQTFTFRPCRFGEYSDLIAFPLALWVNKNYLGYETNDNIVRYGMSNQISPLSPEDPCSKGKKICGSDSTCVVQGAGFTCVCPNGYSIIYLNSLLKCVDIDECTIGTHNCSANADCFNHDGGFECSCRQGYEGNGKSCTYVDVCRNIACDTNAQCSTDIFGNPDCVCNEGFIGNGITCWPEPPPPEQHVCNRCSPYASCGFDNNNIEICYCNFGFTGDGINCDIITTSSTPSPTPVTSVSCYSDADCPSNARCQKRNRRSWFDHFYVATGQCVCSHGFHGDIYDCKESAS